MKLTRRDAVAALAAVGATGGAVFAGRQLSQGDDTESTGNRAGRDGEAEPPSDERVKATLTAIAEVVYPDEVSGIDEFVAGFLRGRLNRPDHAAGIRDAVVELDERSRAWHGDRVAELPAGVRDRLLREVGADTADEHPAGTTAEQIRYYVVNELLLALYASPKGGKLVGIENPQSHPGGIDSYSQEP